MTKLLFLVIAAATATTSACATLPPVSPNPLTYACDDGQVVRHGTELAVGAPGAGSIRRGWEDKAGAHFVMWPHATAQASAVEYVLPHDIHADATTLVWDTSKGTAPVDWRLTGRGSCRVLGGYTDAVALFMGGNSLQDIATELHLADPAEARTLVHDAMIALQRRYFASH